MMEIMMFSPTPKRENIMQTPREIIPRMRVHRLMQPQTHPYIHRNNMQILRQITVEEGTADGSGAEDEDLERVGEFGGEAEGGAVAVMELVDFSVEGAVVQSLVSCAKERMWNDFVSQEYLVLRII